MSQTIRKSASGQSMKALPARKAEDLYSAHDFDIQIEVNVPTQGQLSGPTKLKWESQNRLIYRRVWT